MGSLAASPFPISHSPLTELSTTVQTSLAWHLPIYFYNVIYVYIAMSRVYVYVNLTISSIDPCLKGLLQRISRHIQHTHTHNSSRGLCVSGVLLTCVVPRTPCTGEDDFSRTAFFPPVHFNRYRDSQNSSLFEDDTNIRSTKVSYFRVTLAVLLLGVVLGGCTTRKKCFNRFEPRKVVADMTSVVR